jgi:hypothetical protein
MIHLDSDEWPILIVSVHGESIPVTKQSSTRRRAASAFIRRNLPCLILKQRGDWPIFRIDHNLTKNNSLVVRWLLRETPYVLNNGLPDLIWTRERRHQQSAAGDSHIFSPAIVNNFRLATRRTTSLTEKRKPARHPLLAARSSPPSACKGRIRASCPARDFLK